jgi:hypothetical protein
MPRVPYVSLHTIDWSNICQKVWKDSTMSRMKHASKRKRRSKTLPVLGAAGLSLALTSGASATPIGPAADIATRDTGENHDLTLGEEEISDVSLATFYVFDKENVGTSESDVQLVGHGCMGCHGCGGCHGCRGCGGCHHGCGCHGCHGCHGCGCVSIGIGCGGWWGGCGGGGNCWVWTRFGWVWAC